MIDEQVRYGSPLSPNRAHGYKTITKRLENNAGWTISVTKGESEYLFFEDLSEIIVTNWDKVFKQDLHEQPKVTPKLKELEVIRHAIAHTRTFTPDGMIRL